MGDFINSLKIDPNDLNEAIKLYNSLPNESILKDSLGLLINSNINFIKKEIEYEKRTCFKSL